VLQNVKSCDTDVFAVSHYNTEVAFVSHIHYWGCLLKK